MITVLSVDSSWFDFPMLQICNFTNSGHDGFAIKMFCLAVRRSLLHVSRRDLVSRFQPVSSSAATPVLRPSCIEHSLKRTGESDQLRTSPSRFSRDFAPIPCWVFLEMHSTSTQDFSKSLPCCHSSRVIQLYPRWPVGIPSVVEVGTSVFTMSSTLTLVATEESTRTSALELGPPWIGAEPLLTGTVDVGEFACLHASDPSSALAWLPSWPGFQHVLYIEFLASFALSSESQTSTFFSVGAAASDPRFTDEVSTGAPSGISASCRS